MIDILKYFPLPFDGRFVGEGKFKHLAPFVYHSKLVGTITVPTGEITDAGSIPKIFRMIIGSPWGGRYVLICIIHDYLSRTKKFSRVMTQRVFLEGLIILGVPWWKKPAMYAGVRVYSLIYWREPTTAIILLICLAGCASSRTWTETKRIIKEDPLTGKEYTQEITVHHIEQIGIIKAEHPGGAKAESKPWVELPTFPVIP